MTASARCRAIFDRIMRPEQLLDALPRAMTVLTDPALCGPVTLALCQDVQAEAFDYPAAFFEPRCWRRRADRRLIAAELAEAADALRAARKPLIVAGGGVLYSDASEALDRFATRLGIPVAETQAGKSSLPADHLLNLGAVGVTGTGAANAMAEEADVVLAVGTRLADFTTGSWTLLAPSARIVALNVQPLDASKRAAVPLVADAGAGLEALGAAMQSHRAPGSWTERVGKLRDAWRAEADAATAPSNAARPSDAQVIGAVQRAAGRDAIVVCAAGGLPGELHKLWRADRPGSYHLEYGYSCMGYEIAGGLGVKMARPESDVIVMVGDGSYLMMNSEIATSVAMGVKLTIVLLDNRGFGCINRLQQSTGSPRFNNLLSGPSRRFPRACRKPGCDLGACEQPCRTGAGGAACGLGRPDHGDCHRHRPGGLHQSRRTLVGRAGAGGLTARRGQCRTRRLDTASRNTAPGKLTWQFGWAPIRSAGPMTIYGNSAGAHRWRRVCARRSRPGSRESSLVINSPARPTHFVPC